MDFSVVRQMEVLELGVTERWTWVVCVIFVHPSQEQGFIEIDFSIRDYYKAWGNSGLLSLFWMALMLTGQLRCKAGDTIFQLMFVRSKSFPWLHLTWNEVTDPFRAQEVQMLKYEQTAPSLYFLCNLFQWCW